MSVQAEGYRNFKLSLFCTVGCVTRMFRSPEEARRQFDYYKKHLNFQKVYLECFRGEAIDADLLRTANRFFEERGIKTATGIMPSRSPLFDGSKRTMCFTNPGVRKLFSEYVAGWAKEFDEIMIDDSLATECTCPRCRTAKGNRSWTEFRMQLMTDFCRYCIVAPAKAVNPNVRITLKYPTWHESFQTMGYDTLTQPPLFDSIYSGTETRHTTYSLFRNPRYTSYSLLRYLSSLPPHNNRGGWFDSILCANSTDIFTQQAELTLLADPEEMTLFCWGLNYDTMFPPALGYICDRMDRVLGTLRNGAEGNEPSEPAFLPVYLPHHSRGEDHVYDFMGMCGLPVAPTVAFPDKPVPVLLTAASCCDGRLCEKIRTHLLAGGDVILTSAALQHLQHNPDFEFTAMRVTGRSQTGSEFGAFDAGWSTDVSYCLAPRPISLPVIEWQTNENDFFAVQTNPMSPNILLARSYYAEGRCWVLNIPDTMNDWTDIPAPVASIVRKHLSADMPLWLEGPNNIALFPRTNRCFSVRSYLEHGAPVLFHIRGKAESLVNLQSGKTYAPYTALGDTETVFRVPLEPNCLSFFRWE